MVTMLNPLQIGSKWVRVRVHVLIIVASADLIPTISQETDTEVT